MLHGLVMVVVVSSHRSSPVHARDSESEDAAANTTPPPAIRPGGPPPKEYRQGDCASKYSDYGGPNNVCNSVGACVVADTKLPDIMHTTNRATSKYTPRQDPKITSFFAGSDAIKGDKQDDDWEHKGYAGEFHAVNDLGLHSPVSQDDGTVSDIMHTPDTNTAHGYGGGKQ